MPAHASQGSVRLDPVAPAAPGQPLTIKGDTTLERIVLQIQRPNRTILWTDVVSGERFRSGVSITLPAALAAGEYELLAGAGADRTSIGFQVAAASGGEGGGPTHGDDDDGESASGSAQPSPAGQADDTDIRIGQDGILVAVGKTDASGVVRVVLSREMLEAAKLAGGSSKVRIELGETPGAGTYRTTFPAEAFTAAASGGSYELKTPLGLVHIPANAFGRQELAAAGQVSVVVGRRDASSLPGELQESLRGKPVIALHFELDGRPLPWRNDRAPITVELDYKPAPAERMNHELLAVWHIDEAQRVIPVPNGRFEPSAGKVIFRTTHFSTFAVAYKVPDFRDLNGYEWARKPVEVLAAKGIVQGAAPELFRPERSITRAEFVTLLVRTLELAASPEESSFEDVLPSDYYYEPVEAAKRLGIAQGTAAGRFEPDRPVTRQEMMTLAARALAAAGKLTLSADTSGLARFLDGQEAAPYARESIAALVRQGLIEGADGRLQLQQSSTRAETAVLMYRLYNEDK
ncbi:S-layer homology domain-containing protein [Paenibacillus sp. cl123]|nr:S-layer homology domain-containing protein [Paenibacillus sp. cl123]